MIVITVISVATPMVRPRMVSRVRILCERSANRLSEMSSFSLSMLLKGGNRHIERDRVYHALALELHPQPIGSFAREDDVELNLRTAIREKRMRVDHVDQVFTGGQHVSPGAEVGLQAFARLDAEKQQCLCAGDGL